MTKFSASAPITKQFIGGNTKLYEEGRIKNELILNSKILFIFALQKPYKYVLRNS